MTNRVLSNNSQEITPQMMDLLFMADPDIASIESYLPESKVLVCHDQECCIGIGVLTVSNDVFELKNLAVAEAYQGRGVAKLIISEIKHLAKKLGAIEVEVGTGNSSLSQLALYQKCGFRLFSIESGFFESYPEPIFENGIRCLDLVRLRAKI